MRENVVFSEDTDSGAVPVRDLLHARAVTQPSWERNTESVVVPDPTKRWFVLHDDDRQEGPFSLALLNERIREGSIQRDTYLWQKGMGDWEPAGEIRQLQTLWKYAEAAPDVLSEAHQQSMLGLTPAPFPFPMAAAGVEPFQPLPSAAPLLPLHSQPEVARSERAPPVVIAEAPSFEPQWPEGTEHLANFLFSDLSSPGIRREEEPPTDVADSLVVATPQPLPSVAAAAPKLSSEESTVIVAERHFTDEDTSVERVTLTQIPWWVFAAAGAVVVMVVALVLALRHH